MSYDKNKTCDKTGIDVNEYLLSIGLQTPLTSKVFVSDDEKIDKITGLMTQVMETLGLDLSDDSLNETPKRVAKMYVKELMYGLRPDSFPKCTTVENKFKFNEEFVLVKGMETHSLCEHHLVYFGGKSNSELGNGISIAYCPKEGGKVLGLSKLSRIVDYFARRPQIQERLTQQIAHAVSFITGTNDVVVHAEATHFCMSTRGRRDPGAKTETLCALGRFGEINSSIRREFLAAIKN